MDNGMAGLISPRILLFLLPLLLIAPPANGLPIPEVSGVAAQSYLLMDFHSGQTLAAQSPEKRIEPASITKLMAAYIVFSEIADGNLALGDEVPVSEKAWRMGGSKMFIEVGKRIPVADLLRGMIIVSGNDATVALAEHIAGSEDGFAVYMNQYAKELGLENTHFTNATGWPHPDHYMSALDIARLTRAMIRNFPEMYAKYYREKEFTYNEIKQYNRNSLLWTDPTVDGVKTGHTEGAGYCLVASAERDGMRLISVVTGTDNNSVRKNASASLLNYGFRFFETYKLFAAEQPITNVRVWRGEEKMLPVDAGGPVYVTAPRGARDKLSSRAALPSRLTAPVAEDAELGRLEISFGDESIHELPLYAAESMPAGGLIRRLTDEVLLLFE
jgi:D-alanyl-D-alanine carboxypeptidase (penicillin-binding protein 5/6)